jgi:hypothetical protein
MWTACVLTAALSAAPAQSGQLALTNVRTTYGFLGAPRTDIKFLPGDSVVLSFDIDGLQPDSNGKVLYRIAMEVADSKGVVHFKQTPRDRETVLALGGNRVPAFASLNIGLDQPPGDYTVKVTVSDQVAKASQTLTHTCQVVPKTFGIVRLTTTNDPNGQLPAPFVGEGQSLWVNFATVGFGRDQGKNQPNLSVTLNVRDENGRPTMAKPFMGDVNQNIPSHALALPMQFLLELNRAGKFTIDLTATDKVTGKTTSLSLPLNVMKTK